MYSRMRFSVAGANFLECIAHFVGNFMAKRLTKEEFVERAIAVHGDKYNYDSVEYKNSNHKVSILCGSHGYFQQSPDKHTMGRGCPKCANESRSALRTKKPDLFLIEANKKHGNKYQYQIDGYKNRSSTIKIKCLKHGWFYQKAANHLAGGWCTACGYESVSDKNSLSHREFVEKAELVHGKDKYLYIGAYRSTGEKVAILCRNHGVFYQTPNRHLSGCGCHECAADRYKNAQRHTIEDFLLRARSAHGDTYDYSKVEYYNSATKIEIVCRTHGSFFQAPRDHGKGIGCQKCGFEQSKGIYTLDSIDKEQENIPCKLYLVMFTRENDIFYKVGVTVQSVERRFKYAKKEGFNLDVLHVIESTLLECLTKENEILEKLEHKRYKVHALKNTSIGGWTECFYHSEEVDDVLAEYFS